MLEAKVAVTRVTVTRVTVCPRYFRCLFEPMKLNFSLETLPYFVYLLFLHIIQVKTKFKNSLFSLKFPKSAFLASVVPHIPIPVQFWFSAMDTFEDK